MKRYVLFIAFFTSNLFANFINTHPRFVGLHPTNLKNISHIINQAIHEQKISGALVYGLRNEKIFYKETFGKKEQPIATITIDTTFDVGSLAHLLITLPAIMLLVERGLICLSDSITQYPLIQLHDNKDLQIQDLITLYPHYSINCFQALIEAMTDKSIENFVQEYIFKPLGMTKTLFLQANQQDVIPAKENSPLLFSTAHDLGLFFQMILNNGIHKNKRVLSPVSVKQIISILQTMNKQIPQQPVSFLGDRFMPQAFGFLSNTGISFILDPESKICMIMPFFGIGDGLENTIASIIGRLVNVIAMSIRHEEI